MARKLVINGKFLRAKPTGVHRVAAEIATALGGLKREAHAAVADIDVELWIPHDGVERAATIPLPTRVVGPGTGIPWEQVTLPARAGDALVLNLCNIGPVGMSRAITMIHDAQVHVTPDSYSAPFRLWYRLIQPAFAKRHRRILTVSDFSRRAIAAAGIAEADRITVVHNGADHVLRAAPSDEAVRRLGLSERGFVLALASAQPHKNIGLLFRAFVDPRLADLKLVLIGGSDPLAMAAIGSPPPNAVFTGYVDDEALRGLMEAALCLAFPSTTEGFGLPPLESMILGCPALVTPCGALPEVCGDAAPQLAPDDPEPWIDAILRLRDAPGAWDEASARGREHAAAFTWRRAALTVATEVRTVFDGPGR